MPIYLQQCRNCGERFEIITGSFDAPRPCPRCTSPRTDQLVTAPNFRIAKRQFEVKRGPSHNPYEDLVLQHVRDEHGKPVKVNSERELHAAEKKYNFVHNASWGMADQAPQHESWAGDVRHDYQKKFNRDPAAYEVPAEQQGVSVGVAENAAGTIAHLPNPM